ncbi:Chondroitin synthase [Rubripirellula lacrimiformis]|uniref:Chondroitin synthase n=1 Tax=Rubripirellula lacrimiformis TaxID=1930273 RepID=A0A517NEY9_9BACT|nr:glycosyltransferase family 2 protein [Rubripirellula lacrimiformis]QDT05696.1 Chondroitin synthase [Rubripirellula lacrimiformis]
MAPNLRVVSYDDADRASAEVDLSSPLFTSDGTVMRTSCLINNYNYADFLCEAVQSALEQETPFTEVIVVDDGSTDDSLSRLDKRFRNESRLQVIAKDQEGQLSCLQTAMEIASGDVVYFLDSDDRHRPDLNTKVQSVYEQQPSIDCISVGYESFGDCAGGRQRIKVTRDQGISAVGAVMQRRWVGAPTSCLSMRSSLVRKILPYPRESEWKTRADDVLVFGSSIVGSHKFHLEEPLVEYRRHGANHFAGRSWSAAEKMRYSLEVNRMTGWYVEKMGYELSTFPRLASREFRTIEKPTVKEWLQYLRMASHPSLTLGLRMGNLLSVTKHYVRERVSRKGNSLAPTARASQTVTPNKLDEPSDASEHASGVQGPAAANRHSRSIKADVVPSIVCGRGDLPVKPRRNSA